MIPDNGGFAVAAYVAASIIYVGYALTLRVRTRRLAQRLAQLNEQAAGRR